MSGPGDEPPINRNVSHLTELVTSWTTIRTAHIPGPEGQAAMGELIGRYHDAVLRYLGSSSATRISPTRSSRSSGPSS